MKLAFTFLFLSVLSTQVLAEDPQQVDHQHSVDRIDRYGNTYSDTLNHTSEKGDGYATADYQRVITNKATGQSLQKSGQAEINKTDQGVTWQKSNALEGENIGLKNSVTGSVNNNDDGSKTISVSKTSENKAGQSIVKTKDYQVNRNADGGQVQKTASIVTTGKDGQVRSISQSQDNQWQKYSLEGRDFSSVTQTSTGGGRSTTLNRSLQTSRNEAGRVKASRSRSRGRQ